MSRQPGKPKDDIWKHVKTLDDGTWQCNFCGYISKTGATRIRAHLSGTKGKGIAICEKVPDDVKSKALKEVADSRERVDYTQADTRATQLPIIQPNSSSSGPVGQPVAGDQVEVVPREEDMISDSSVISQRLKELELLLMESPTTEPERAVQINCSSLLATNAGDQMQAVTRAPQLLVKINSSTSDSLGQHLASDQTQADTRAPQLPAEINNNSFGPLGQHLAVNASDQREAEARNEEMRCKVSYGIGESECALMIEDQPMEIIRCTPAATEPERPSCSSQQDANAMNVTEEGRDTPADEAGTAINQVNQHGKKRKVDVMNELVDPRQLADRKGFIGQEFLHNIAWMRELLMDETVSIIGVFGMGGVGKTALATQTKKEIVWDGIFNHVHWITVSQECSIHKLQTHIAKRFGLRLDEDDDRMRAEELSEALETKEKELLILDDVWKKIDLEKVGIPLRMGGIKLILTTRLKPVCLQMNCPPNNIIEVKPLSDEEAWDLFLQKLRFDEKPVKLADEVLGIARCFARECNGLPLGIKVLATVMKGVEDIHQWRYTLNELQNWTLEEEEVEDEIFRVLRFSYHKLNDKRMQKCFLYCALYPEDKLIEREELIMRFVDQGLINRMKRLEEIFDEGHTMLNKLVDSSLLEEAYTDFTRIKCVKMHDLLRDMACRIVKVSPMYMIKSGKGLRKVPQTDEWTANLEVVSFMVNQIEEIPSCTSPSCPELSTLIFSENPLKCIPDIFFDHMPALTVLDFSSTGVKGLPYSICNMKALVSLQLNNCRYLKYVPPLGNLQALSRLVLSGTSIQVLPEGLEKLTNLKWLDLSYNEEMKSWSRSFMSKLINLQCLILGVGSQSQISVKVEDLEGMNNLEIFKGIFHADGCLNAYVRNVLDRGYGPNNYYIKLGSNTLRHDEKHQSIIFKDCEDIDHLVQKDARHLSIIDNKQWRCLCDALSFSGASSMISCIVCTNSQLETLFCLSCSCSPTPFCTNLQNLERLELSRLGRLAALWKENEDKVESLNSVAFFPCLTCINIVKCDNMEKLLKRGMLAHLPNLVSLRVRSCEKMKEIFSGVDGDNGVDGDEVMVGPHNSNSDNADALTIVLPKLEKLELKGLPELENVWQGIMACHSFREFSVINCPKLRRPQIRSNFEIQRP